MTFSAKQAPTWALVPLKSHERAKSRLAAELSVQQRLHLFFSLAEGVIRALRATHGIDSVAVVTASEEIAAFARSLGAVPLRQSADFGMTAAFDLAIDELQATQLRRVLMLPGDLPLISPAALEAVLAAADEPGIVVVPDRHRAGTNALLCSPPRALAPCFGGRSFERHLAAAAANGIKVRVLELADLGLDLDYPEDLEYLRRCHGVRATQLLGAALSGNAAAETCVASRCAGLAVNQ